MPLFITAHFSGSQGSMGRIPSHVIVTEDIYLSSVIMLGHLTQTLCHVTWNTALCFIISKIGMMNLFYIKGSIGL